MADTINKMKVLDDVIAVNSKVNMGGDIRRCQYHIASIQSDFRNTLVNGLQCGSSFD